MTKAVVVFATITGNNEDVADLITDALENLGVDVDEKEITMADVADFEDADICVVCPYTYDEGALPEEGLDFYDDPKFTGSPVRAIPSTPMITAGPLTTSAPPLKAPGPPKGPNTSTSTSPRKVMTSTRWTPLPPAWLKRRRANNGRPDCPVAEV